MDFLDICVRITILGRKFPILLQAARARVEGTAEDCEKALAALGLAVFVDPFMPFEVSSELRRCGRWARTLDVELRARLSRVYQSNTNSVDSTFRLNLVSSHFGGPKRHQLCDPPPRIIVCFDA